MILFPGEKYGIGTEESKIRYAMLEDMLQGDSSYSMDGIRDALDSVSKHNFDSEFASTEWSIAYNQSTGEVRYYHREVYDRYYCLYNGVKTLAFQAKPLGQPHTSKFRKKKYRDTKLEVKKWKTIESQHIVRMISNIT